MNVRLALCLTESKDHSQPGAQGRRLPARALLLLLFCSLPHCLLLPWQQAILGQPRLCVAMPNGGVARGNGAYLEGLSKPSPGTLEIVYFLARSSKKIIPPGQIQLVLLTLGHWGNSSLDQDMEAQGPVTTGPMSPHYRLQPPGAPLTPPAGQAGERGWALLEEVQRGTPSREGQGEDPSTLTIPPVLRQHTRILCKTVNMA